MAIGYGEYVLNLDPYNFESEEEFIKFYHPKLKKRSLKMERYLNRYKNKELKTIMIELLKDEDVFKKFMNWEKQNLKALQQIHKNP